MRFHIRSPAQEGRWGKSTGVMNYKPQCGFIKQEGIPTANTHEQRAPGLVALCHHIQQLCSLAAGSLEHSLINPDSNQLPDTAPAAAVSALTGFNPIIPTVSFCCPRKG